MFQVSCFNGYPEINYNLQYSLLKTAAIGTLAATRVSWYVIVLWESTGDSDNAEIGYEFVRNLVDRMSAGEALYYGKAQLTTIEPAWVMNPYDFNLYGDPSMTLEGTSIPREPQTIYVDGDLQDYPQANYTTITDALNAAFPKDTIIEEMMIHN